MVQRVRGPQGPFVKLLATLAPQYRHQSFPNNKHNRKAIYVWVVPVVEAPRLWNLEFFVAKLLYRLFMQVAEPNRVPIVLTMILLPFRMRAFFLLRFLWNWLR